MFGAIFCGLAKRLAAGMKRKRCSQKIGTRIGEIECQLERIEHRPRVAILEWLQPFYVAGHWVPEMIEMAGGKDVLGRKRTPSFRVSAEDVIEAAPEILLIAQCGYSAKQARDEYQGMIISRRVERDSRGAQFSCVRTGRQRLFFAAGTAPDHRHRGAGKNPASGGCRQSGSGEYCGPLAPCA